MDKKPLFSIVIPTYNSSEKLRRALDSVNRQIFRDFEVIICDDGSSDHTKQVADTFYGKFDFRYLWNEHWGGPALSRNNGIKIAQGEYIAFLDDDDWWYPDKLEVVKNYIQNADIIYHDLDICTPHGKKIFKKVKGRHLRSPVFIDLMVNENALINSSVIARKTTIEQAGGLIEEESLISMEDFDLWLKIAKITEKFVYIPKSLGAYLMDKDNISVASERRIGRIKEVYRRHLDGLKNGDKKQSEAVLSYLLGRIKQKMGLPEDALRFFKISMKSKNIKFKFRSLCWIILIRYYQITERCRTY